MFSNFLYCLMWAAGVILIFVLEGFIVFKILQIWDKAHPVDKRGGSNGKKNNRSSR